MLGERFAIKFVNVLCFGALVTIFSILLIWVACRSRAQRPTALTALMWGVTFSVALALLYSLAAYGLEFLWFKGSTRAEGIYAFLNRPAIGLINLLAYKGTGWIDKPLLDDTLLVLRCSASLCFWGTFVLTCLLILGQRSLK